VVNFILRVLFVLFLVLAKLALVLIVAGPGVLGQVDQRPECALWGKVENKTVPLQNQVSMLYNLFCNH
jgi:hypothetical protein